MNKKMNVIAIGLLFVYIYLHANSYTPETFYLSSDFLIGVGALMALNFVRSIFELVRGNGAEASEHFFNVFLVPIFVMIILIGFWAWENVRANNIF